MNALQSYSSDEESGNEAPAHKTRKSGDPGTNYDDVGMDIIGVFQLRGMQPFITLLAGGFPISHSKLDSDEELPPAHQARERASARPAGNPPRQQGAQAVTPSQEEPLLTNAEANKNQSETKEGQRSSLQERLLGLASGGSQRMSQAEERGVTRDRRENHSSSPSRDREGHSRRKSRSKSPKSNSPKSKAKSSKSRSPAGGSRSDHKTRSRSKSRERDVGRTGQQNRDHTSRSHSSRDQTSQGHSGRGRDCRKGREDDRKRRDEERRSRRSRSRSRSRDRRRSRSRSRERRSRSRSRSRERRRRSRSRERKRPMDIRKEAQQKLAALKAANPDLTAAELLKRSMEAQVVEVQKQTGITLPSYYNPAAMNPMKFAEQERKKKLLWGNKNKTPETPPGLNPVGMAEGLPGLSLPAAGGSAYFGARFPPPVTVAVPPVAPAPLAPTGTSSNSGGQAALWANTRFSNDRDGKMAEKFRRLMGVKNQGDSATAGTKDFPSGSGKDKGVDILQKQETMFSSMERQYEMARIATHTHKGFGLGFTSQSFIPK